MELILPDSSFFTQAIIFFIALFVISSFILKPITEILKGRKEHIEGAEQEEARLKEQSSQLDTDYKVKMKEARSQAQKERSSKRQEALAEERVILEKSREEAQGVLQGIRLEIKNESEEARARLRQEAKGLSRLLTEKLLGRPVQ